MSEIEQLRQEVAQLRVEVDRVDEWANGLFWVLHDVLPWLLRRDPEMAAALAQQWREAAQHFAEVSAEEGQAASFDETAERLEARKMLYRLFDVLRLWPVRA